MSCSHNIPCIDNSSRLGGLFRLVTSLIPDNHIGVNSTHERRLASTTIPVSTARISSKEFGGPPQARRPKASSGRVLTTDAGSRWSKTPFGLFSTTSRVLASQRRARRMDLGRMNWPLVETVVVSCSAMWVPQRRQQQGKCRTI